MFEGGTHIVWHRHHTAGLPNPETQLQSSQRQV